MQLSSHVIAFIAAATWTLAAAESSSSPVLPCYQASCSTLIDQLKACQVALDPSSGNLNFPVQANTSATTDKCLCKQSIINAYGTHTLLFSFLFSRFSVFLMPYQERVFFFSLNFSPSLFGSQRTVLHVWGRKSKSAGPV